MALTPDPRPIVEMLDIVKSFPGVRALDKVSFTVMPGEIHALVGKNGAGKSTLMHILSGLYTPDEGEIRIAGEVAPALTPARARQLGIAIVSQHAKFVPGLSIAENMLSGSLPTGRGGFIDWPSVRAGAADRLRRVGLDIDVRRPMESVSLAERQMIEIARALSADARVIILDEPTAPLPKHEVQALFRFVRRQREHGASFIYISHYLEEVFEVADRATALRNGRVAGSAPVTSLSQPELIRMISGATVENFRRPARTTVGPVVLEVQGLSRPGVYDDLSLTLHGGELVGLTGLEGSGTSALALGLFGLQPVGTGAVRLDGKPYTATTPGQALRSGIAYVPRDRHRLGIIGMASVRHNVSLPVLHRLSNFLGLIDGSRERALVEGYVDTLGIKTPNLDVHVENLSGGNQQKVVVAKFAATRPRVLLLDEPTQGVDVQAKVEILRIVDALAADGVAIAIISDELSELIDTCDRILVFYRGRIVREFRKGTDEMTTERLLESIEGGGLGASDAVA